MHGGGDEDTLSGGAAGFWREMRRLSLAWRGLEKKREVYHEGAGVLGRKEALSRGPGRFWEEKRRLSRGGELSGREVRPDMDKFCASRETEL